MINTNKKLFLFVFFAIVFLLEACSVFALEVDLPGLSSNPTVPEYLKYFFNLGIGLAGGLAILTMVIGGFHYLVSFGMGKVTSAGKDWIKSGITGLLILACSYLIVSTINPQLTFFRLGDLIAIPIPGDNPIIWTPPSPEGITYKEIPIGTLTENVLARTIDCYEFDLYGEPIDGNPNTPELEPGLMNHDRVDCFLKLAEAATKKAEIFKDLSDEIVELMEKCDCYIHCQEHCPDCNYFEVVNHPSKCNLNACNVECWCECPAGDPDCDSCPEGVKEKIEHGLICVNNKLYKGLDEFRREPHPNIEKEIEIEGKRVRIIRRDVWEELRLIDKFRYLKMKLDDEKQKIREDSNLLKRAETKLGECYLAKPYVEFLKIVEETKKEDEIIAKQKIFRDPYTNKYIDISRYCKGFFYADAKCYQTCRNICPGINPQSFQLLKSCSANNLDCLKASFNRCPVDSIFNSFQDCLGPCKNKCLKLCQERYNLDLKPECENGEEAENGLYEECVNKCNNDSRCILENEEKCYIDFQSLKKCADKYNNFENFENCARTTFRCKYCTDQQAGYPDCLKSLGGEYSSSFLYRYPEKQRCPDCYEEIYEENSCVDLYPETAKCPSCSNCPECPCSSQITPGVSYVYRLCNGECGEYSYNDDPLTFYCRGEWWERWWEREEPRIPTEPLGKEWSCEKKGEIPVGQAVDEAEKWVEELLRLIDNFVEKTNNMIGYITDIGNEKDYCECESLCNGDEKTCEPPCEYHEVEMECEDPRTGEWKPCWKCYCVLMRCEGNPCQKMINLLKGKEADEDCPKGVEYKGVEWYYERVEETFEELKNFSVEARSEILKKLIYSRKKMDECSEISAGFEKEARLLSCERVIDEIIPPIVNGKVIIENKILEKHCYGKEAGKILITSSPLADNWFCCEEAKKD